MTSLADAGELDRGRAVLDAWPESDRDARYWRLRGRWELEYEHRPEQAANAFQTALERASARLANLVSAYRVPYTS